MISFRITEFPAVGLRLLAGLHPFANGTSRDTEMNDTSAIRHGAAPRPRGSRRRTVRWGWLLTPLLVGFAAVPAHAAIPQSERDVLIALYDSTNGDNWNDKSGWNGATGTECSWYGVVCDEAETHVTGIVLSENNLTGSLPPIADLTNLQEFYVDGNQLSGSIPSLAGLTSLEAFWVLDNQLSGPIPPLVGLTSLAEFVVGLNALSGPIPSLAGLTNLGLFNAPRNNLSGEIPSLVGLTNLYSFSVGGNQTLSGPLPSLAGLTNLQYFYADTNQLSGPIPSLTGLTSLIYFVVWHNQLSGSIPSLAGLTSLEWLDVSDNQLSGSIPSLEGLTSLGILGVSGNQLSGDVPDVPDPNALWASESDLCPNFLNPTPNPDWDTATGQTPWYADCSPMSDLVYADGFDGP